MAENYVVSLMSLLRRDVTSINLVFRSLQIRGYAFILLEPKLVSLIDECQSAAENFFAQNVDEKRFILKNQFLAILMFNTKKVLEF